MAGRGLLALAALGLLANILAPDASSSPPARRSLRPARRTGAYHWHVTGAFGTKHQYFLEYRYTNNQGHPVYECPFCHSVYVKRPR
jgi:hypothetical protein